VTILLPASEQEVKAEPQPLGGHEAGGKGRVLVLDDDAMILTVVKKGLERLGYSVEGVSEGAQAVILFKQAYDEDRLFDVALLDLTVPGGYGGERVLKEIRLIDPGVKAVVSSGYSDDPVMSRYRDYGFSAMIKKPFTIQELSSVMRQLADD